MRALDMLGISSFYPAKGETGQLKYAIVLRLRIKSHYSHETILHGSSAHAQIIPF